MLIGEKMSITVEGRELGIEIPYTEDFSDADLDIADGEVTILEKGAVGGAINYRLEEIDLEIVALGVGAILTFKLYVDINGVITELTDERVQKTATGSTSLYFFVSSDYVKVTVQATVADNNSIESTSNWNEKGKA